MSPESKPMPLNPANPAPAGPGPKTGCVWCSRGEPLATDNPWWHVVTIEETGESRRAECTAVGMSNVPGAGGRPFSPTRAPLVPPDRQTAIRAFFRELQELQARHGLRVGCEEGSLEIYDTARPGPRSYPFSAVISCEPGAEQSLEITKWADGEDRIEVIDGGRRKSGSDGAACPACAAARKSDDSISAGYLHRSAERIGQLVCNACGRYFHSRTPSYWDDKD